MSVYGYIKNGCEEKNRHHFYEISFNLYVSFVASEIGGRYIWCIYACQHCAIMTN